MSSILKVSEAFQRYRTCRRNGTLVHNMLQIFDSMTLYILSSKEVDYNFDLLQQLSLIQKEGTISQSPSDYQLAKEFRQFFKTYAEYQAVKKQNHVVVMAIVETTKALIIEAKTSIYNFIWSLPGFRKALSNISTQNDGVEFNGADYTKNSIFSSILSAYKKEYTSNKKSALAFKSLTEKMSRQEFDSVFGYLMKIVRANRAYTFDNVLSYKDTLSSFELLGTILILAIKLLQNNPEHVFWNGTTEVNPEISGRMQDVWDLIDILYFTLFEIKRSTAESYRINNDELQRLSQDQNFTGEINLTRETNNRMKRRKALVEEGKQGLERLITIVAEIDNAFVDSIIFSNSSIILEQNNASVIFRLRRYLLERNIKPNTSLSSSVCYFVNSLLKSRGPPGLKAEYIRLIMAYDLCKEYVKIGESEGENNPFLENLTTYLLGDGRKLQDIALIHALDILEHFSRFLIVSNSSNSANSASSSNKQRCAKATRLYLGYLKESNEIYEQMTSVFLNVPEHVKPSILTDMMAVASYCKDLIVMMEQIGNEALEYLDSLLCLIEKVVNTKKLLKIPDEIDPKEIEIMDRVGPTYVKKFRPLLLDLLHKMSESAIFIFDDQSPISDEWRSIYSMYTAKPDLSFSDTIFRLIIRSESVRILKDIFSIDLTEEEIPHLMVPSDSNIDHVDAITYDLLVSPVAIPTSSTNNEYVLVNQRTMHRILLDGSNPFTRQPLTYAEVISLNERPDVRADIDQVFDFIRKYSS